MFSVRKLKHLRHWNGSWLDPIFLPLGYVAGRVLAPFSEGEYRGLCNPPCLEDTI